MKIIVLILLAINIAFLFAIWHMSHNFMAKRHGKTKTSGALNIETENAYRISEYIALLSFVLMDILFIFYFL